MVILDTNVISEPMKEELSEAVASWLDRQEHGTLCVTSVNIAELGYHVGSRILPFDNDAAEEFVILMVKARKKGVSVSPFDAQIATYRGCAVATRDDAPFKAMGVDVINPWLNQ